MDDEWVRLAQTMSALAVGLQDETDNATTLRAIVDSAVSTIPGASYAGISLVHGKQTHAEIATDDLVREIDELQSQFEEGPGVTAIRQHHTVRIDDLAEQDQRWPRFAAKAVERGVYSMISFRLFVRSENMGSLNLYASEAHAFTDDAEIVGELFAQHAAVAMAGASEHAQLNTALVNRDIIGQAKGILIQREHITGQQAFDLLVQASQQANIKVSEVARWLVEQSEPRAAAAPDDD